MGGISFSRLSIRKTCNKFAISATANSCANKIFRTKNTETDSITIMQLQKSLSAAALFGAACGSALATDFYQGKSVNIIVSYPPGDGNDVYARLLASLLNNKIHTHPWQTKAPIFPDGVSILIPSLRLFFFRLTKIQQSVLFSVRTTVLLAAGTTTALR